MPSQVGWQIAEGLLFSGRVVEADEATRFGLRKHLVPCEEIHEKTLEIARTIAGNRHESVMGIKELLLQDKGADMQQM